MARKSRDLTNGKVGKQLVKLALPMLFGMLGIVIFNLADAYFVGKLGVKQLAAMSFTFPVIMFINSLSLGVGIGTASLISRNIVSSERIVVKMMASRAIVLGIIVVVFFVSLGLLTIHPLFNALGASSDIMVYINDYMSIWYYGVIFVVIPMIGNNIVRATGDTMTPGILMISSSVVNIILDPLLIFGYGPFPAMGIKGAALATVIARGVGLMFILIILIRREKLLTIRLGRLSEIFSTWNKVIYIAAPAALGMLVPPISIGFITKIIAGFGKEAVAAFGVASRIEMFALMVIASLGSVLIIFIGQNFSKLKFERIFKALKYSGRFSIAWGVFIFILFMLFANFLASVFSSNQQVINITADYLKIVGSSYGFQGLVMLSTSSFNGINKPYPSTIFSIIRMLVLYVPLAWFGSKMFGLYGVFGAALISNVVVGTLSFSYLFRTVRREELRLS